jgi:hypothetical protein
VKAVADVAAEKRMVGKGVKMSCEGITDQKNMRNCPKARGTLISCMKFKDLEAANA